MRQEELAAGALLAHAVSGRPGAPATPVRLLDNVQWNAYRRGRPHALYTRTPFTTRGLPRSPDSRGYPALMLAGAFRNIQIENADLAAAIEFIISSRTAKWRMEAMVGGHSMLLGGAPFARPTGVVIGLVHGRHLRGEWHSYEKRREHLREQVTADLDRRARKRRDDLHRFAAAQDAIGGRIGDYDVHLDKVVLTIDEFEHLARRMK